MFHWEGSLYEVTSGNVLIDEDAYSSLYVDWCYYNETSITMEENPSLVRVKTNIADAMCDLFEDLWEALLAYIIGSVVAVGCLLIVCFAMI